MKHIRLFEDFNEKPNSGNLPEKIVKALKIIVSEYKEEYGGNTVHISEHFGNGRELRDLADTVNDVRIKKILKDIARCSREETRGSMENILEYINNDDCVYIANFLGLPPLDMEEEWTEEEEDTWIPDNWWSLFIGIKRG